MRLGRGFSIRSHLPSQFAYIFSPRPGIARATGDAPEATQNVIVTAGAAQGAGASLAPSSIDVAATLAPAVGVASALDSSIHTPGIARAGAASSIATVLAPLDPTVVVGGFGAPPGTPISSTADHEVTVEHSVSMAVGTAFGIVKPIVAGVAAGQAAAFDGGTSSSHTVVTAAAAGSAAAAPLTQIVLAPDLDAATGMGLAFQPVASVTPTAAIADALTRSVSAVITAHPSTASAIATCEQTSVVVRMARTYAPASATTRWRATAARLPWDLTTSQPWMFDIRSDSRWDVGAMADSRWRVRYLSIASDETSGT